MSKKPQGADGAVHMCEEIINATTVVPRAMMFSIAVNGILGFAITVAICFCLGDIETALESPTGFPFLEMFSRATNNLGSATAMAVLIELLIVSCHISIMAAASRMMWAFARDFGLPGSRYLNRVRQFSHIFPGVFVQFGLAKEKSPTRNGQVVRTWHTAHSASRRDHSHLRCRIPYFACLAC